MEKTMAWVKANPIMAAGIAVGTVALIYVATSKKAQQALGFAPKPKPRRRRKATTGKTPARLK